jgi:hypothetical protein
MGALRACPKPLSAAAARPGARQPPAGLTSEQLFLASLITNVAEGSRLLPCDHLPPLTRAAAALVRCHAGMSCDCRACAVGALGPEMRAEFRGFVLVTGELHF